MFTYCKTSQDSAEQPWRKIIRDLLRRAGDDIAEATKGGNGDLGVNEGREELSDDLVEECRVVLGMAAEQKSDQLKI